MALSITRLRAIVPSDPYRCRRCFVALFGMCLGFLVLDRPAMAQSAVANYDETKVGLYTLPDPLLIRSSRGAYRQGCGLPLPASDLSIDQFNRGVPGFQRLQLVRPLRPLERRQKGQDGVGVNGLDQMVVEARLA